MATLDEILDARRRECHQRFLDDQLRNYAYFEKHKRCPGDPVPAKDQKQPQEADIEAPSPEELAFRDQCESQRLHEAECRIEEALAEEDTLVDPLSLL